MEPLPSRLSVPRAVALALIVLAAPGCLLADKCKSCKVSKDSPPPPSPDCCQVVTTWSNKVHFLPDPTKGGALGPGLAGRLYLFGSQIDADGLPKVGDGMVSVELYDDSGPQPGGVQLEQWHFDQGMLQQLLKRDTVGWGYTLFLPWGSYRPELTKVHLNVRYTPQTGSPLFAPATPITLNHEAPPPGVTTASATAPMQHPSMQQLHMPRRLR